MRADKDIDYDDAGVADNETLLRLLCSPLFYDEATGQVNADTFDLRMLGRQQKLPEHYVSIGRECKFSNAQEKLHYLQFGYVKNSAPYHIGMYYAESDEKYFKGPLPKNNPEILMMLTDLAAMIEDNIQKAPPRDKD